MIRTSCTRLSEGFQRITQIVEQLEQEYVVSEDWCLGVRNHLKKAKCYLKTEYRVHCRDEDKRCADHCRKFSLRYYSKHQCLHDHLSKCNSCEELKTVLQSAEGKINELRCTPKSNIMIFCMTLKSPSTSSTNGNAIFSDVKTKRSQNKASYKT